MKKKFVSSLVFVILTAGFHARAQVGDVDNSATGVEKYSYVCTSDDENSSVTLKIKNVFDNGGQVMTGKVLVENGSVLGLNSEYVANVSFENSIFYNVTTYTLLDASKNALGEFVISKQNLGMSRGGLTSVFCGRAGCGDDLVPLPSCGRGMCNPPPPAVVKKSTGLLKIYEKETSFTCH